MNLNVKESYNTMVDFLDKLYWETRADEFANFLSGLLLLSDGSTADPAEWYEWIDSVNNIKKLYGIREENENVTFTLKQAYEIAQNFFDEYYKITNSAYEDFGNLIRGMTLLENEKSTDPRCWQDWVDSANKIKKLGDKAGIMFWTKK
ncbi:TPA: hypothetical protein DEO28_03520 [Candidatus Dependentiae bacterium]|nr:MAG: hypothetical protein UR14_C0007G0005 [candidate division TM6 bacterium GW2011_GWE2_31_21]KKP53634.1 MAG: hypothetical protein UR43_C0004G0175 [candidate division TM6 bacterium GW2011_GWF2_33_332]HBS48127.1 hypothetical protein [Candidatus Dependentiae bacterium]HBZ73551.1 hypothetical protein [Candidatus Dependentiae bacterium]